jgi:hypothetical protein
MDIKNKIGTSPEYLGNAIVAFIDILGYSKFITDNWMINDRKLNRSFLFVNELRDFISNARPETEAIINFGPAITHKIFACDIRLISDTLILTTFCTNSMFYADYRLLLSNFFTTICFCWRNLLEFGLTVRGGIDFGQVYWNVNDITGPVLVDAYNLEKSADTSRIILGKNFLNYFQDTLFSKITKEYIYNSQKQSLLIVDFDDKISFNPNWLWGVYKDGEYRSPESSRIEVIKIVETLEHKFEDLKYKNKYTKLKNTLENYQCVKIPTIEILNEYLKC